MFDFPYITPPDYPTLFFFEVGEWYDYIALIATVAVLAFVAWLVIRYKWAVVIFSSYFPLV
ncbi:hypothetical protein [Arcanobacterium buesumense]|uniref:Uncharacterized protein n=1 Tax=Arcanobacterium buesumense TaxID=2722751 RepID=A0A6H2EJW0_9ACTO|nr:hypothetical protein HC352_04615 [Arcanobacterium buesumense]